MQLSNYHHFHIPVMGTGHSADTPIRVAPFGISSVISLVDDILLEQLRQYYSSVHGREFIPVPRNDIDGRSKRITAYLNLVNDLVQEKIEFIKALPFDSGNDKEKYFDLLPNDIALKQEYQKFFDLEKGAEKEKLAEYLNSQIKPGSIDVNIMVKLDRVNYHKKDVLSDEYRDAHSALKGFADSKLNGSMVFSAGINQSLFNYMTNFKDFYRDEKGELKKRIIIKISDYRSALIQGKYLAKKGLEVTEFRIESGLNCGGHAFASDGQILPVILQEIKENRDQLTPQLNKMVRRYYDKRELEYPDHDHAHLFTVQGGIGTHGEQRRLTEYYNMDRTGWASPFLLVPEATPIDEETMDLLERSTSKDLYLSPVSPLGVPFNNIHGSGSAVWTQNRIDEGKPGSPCPKGFLVSNLEFSEKEMCTASRFYQKRKLEELDESEQNQDTIDKAKSAVMKKTCICDHLGNGALISLGMAEPAKAPQSICPGPNIAWFTRRYTLKEMIGHIYGKQECLVSKARPHMFGHEIKMYVDYFKDRIIEDPNRDVAYIEKFKNNLLDGMDYCLEEFKEAYPDENLATLPDIVHRERIRLQKFYAEYQKRQGAKVSEEALAS